MVRDVLCEFFLEDLFGIDVYDFLVSLYRIFSKIYLKTKKAKAEDVVCHFSLQNGRIIERRTQTWLERVWVLYAQGDSRKIHRRLLTVILGSGVGMGRSCGQMREKLILTYNLLNCLNLAMLVITFLKKYWLWKITASS